jgi:2'-5' RNA ligase
MARVFFALWPDEKPRAALANLGKDLHALYKGRMVPATSLHMTLVFVGNVPELRLSNLSAVALALKGNAFKLDLNRYGCWPCSQVAWVGAESVPPALASLVEQLKTHLAGVGMGFDAKPFAPHITLIRKARCLKQEAVIKPIRWSVTRFVLVQSRMDASGSRYEILNSWSLTSQQPVG